MDYKNELIKVIKEYFEKDDIEFINTDLEEKFDIIHTLTNGLLTDFYQFFELDYKSLLSNLIFASLDDTIKELDILSYIAKGYNKGVRFDKDQMAYLEDLIRRLNDVRKYYELEKDKREAEFNIKKDKIVRSNALVDKINNGEIIDDVDLIEDFMNNSDVPLELKRQFLIYLNRYNTELISNNISKVPRMVKVDIEELSSKEKLVKKRKPRSKKK